MKNFKIVFFGTPEFSVPILKALFESDIFEIVLVVSQPDRPAGRKLKLTPSPVKSWALENGLPVLTPESCKTEDFIDQFRNLNVDGSVVVAFGQILNQKLLNLCPNKFINIHASLLPRWRGAAPIQRAIMSGDQVSGISAQVMVKRLDAGDVIYDVQTEISKTENSIELHDRLSLLAANSIVDGLSSYFEGRTSVQPQDETLVTYAAKIEKNETWVDWSKSSQQIWNHIRGLALGPGGACHFQQQRLKLIQATPLRLEDFKTQFPSVQFVSADSDQLHHFSESGSPYFLSKAECGQVVFIENNSFYVACGEESFLCLTKVQPESKAVMTSKDFINGYQLKIGEKLL